MTQQDVLKLLERNKGKKFTSREVNKKLKFSCASENLFKLYRDGFIKRNEIRSKKNGYYYWI